MQSRLVLVSEDADFFEYIASKLLLRKNDEVLLLNFEELPSKLNLIKKSVLIINSENTEHQTLELLKLVSGIPSVIFAYNEEEAFKVRAFKSGAFAFVTPLTPDEELQALLISGLNITSLLEKNIQYRDILVQKNIIKETNEVLLDYNAILDQELEKIRNSSCTSVLVAISPDDRTKFLVNPNQIETIILSNIRKNDILMNYAASKYFLLLYDADIDDAKKIWAKISEQLPERIYAGFAKTFSKSRQQLVNEALNKLHEAINYDKVYSKMLENNRNTGRSNFKLFRQELQKKVENVVLPVFYQVKQKYTDKLFGIIIEQGNGDGYNSLCLRGRNASAMFKITTPGFANINIDITYASSPNNIDAKRISLTPEEFESGLLEDLLEQFIQEFKKEVNNGTT